MNAQDWQAVAEVIGVLFVIGNFLGGMFIYRLTAKFVTRAEHDAMLARMDNSEEKVERIDKALSKLVTTDEMSAVYNRLGTVEQLAATMNGKLGGISDMLASTNHMLSLLVKNELEGGRKP